jgi:hypothetical protein
MHIGWHIHIPDVLSGYQRQIADLICEITLFSMSSAFKDSLSLSAKIGKRNPDDPPDCCFFEPLPSSVRDLTQIRLDSSRYGDNRTSLDGE